MRLFLLFLLLLTAPNVLSKPTDREILDFLIGKFKNVEYPEAADIESALQELVERHSDIKMEDLMAQVIDVVASDLCKASKIQDSCFDVQSVANNMRYHVKKESRIPRPKTTTTTLSTSALATTETTTTITTTTKPPTTTPIKPTTQPTTTTQLATETTTMSTTTPPALLSSLTESDGKSLCESGVCASTCDSADGKMRPVDRFEGENCTHVMIQTDKIAIDTPAGKDVSLKAGHAELEVKNNQLVGCKFGDKECVYNSPQTTVIRDNHLIIRVDVTVDDEDMEMMRQFKHGTYRSSSSAGSSIILYVGLAVVGLVLVGIVTITIARKYAAYKNSVTR